MTDDESLSPEAARDLRRITAGGDPALTDTICLECGHLNPIDAWTCMACEARLMVPWGTISDGYLTALDLLRDGELEATEVRDLLDNLRRTQSLYMAGTKYSVFGKHPPLPAWGRR